MKKLFLVITTIAFCNGSEDVAKILNPTDGVYPESKNKELVENFYKAIQEKDDTAIKEMVTTGYTIVDASVPYQTDYSKFDAMSKKLSVRVQALHDAFPDVSIKTSNMISEGNYVFASITITGTQKGPFLGVEPTNKPVTIKTFALITIEDGKISTIQEIWNELAVMKEIGYIAL